ncbi:male-enhanced antigen 1 [Centroberyx gerrardi]
MEVLSGAMGPERVLPSSEDELGEEERPAEGGAARRGGGEVERGGGGRGGRRRGEGGEEEEENNNGGYYYQPLNQEPDGLSAGEGEAEEQDSTHAEQLQEVQQRIEMMGLHLPEAPAPDSDEEDDPEGAAAQRSHASIPMDADHVELVKRTMAAVALPSLGVPAWAREISDDQWEDMVQHTLQSRQSAAGLRLHRRAPIN